MQANTINGLPKMENSVIFASQMNPVMRDYQLQLDDDIAIKAEKLFGSEEAFKHWLEKKVKQWLQSWFDNPNDKFWFHNGGLSDEALAEILKDFPPLTQEAFPELSKEDYINWVKSQAGHLPKGLEKWL